MTEVIATLPPRKEAAKRILEAIERKELQVQQPGYNWYTTGCLYAGPCAVGVLIPEGARAVLDRHSASKIRTLLRDGVVLADDADKDFYIIAQGMHDASRVYELEGYCRRTIDEATP